MTQRAVRKSWLIMCLTFVVGAGAVAPGTAMAGLNPVVGDCYANTALTHHYSVQQLRRALSQIPTSIAEYSPCADIIRSQLNKELGGSGLTLGSGGSGDSFLPWWLIVLLLLVLAGGGGATVAARRRSRDAPPSA